jgi:hypothetical protein
MLFHDSPPTPLPGTSVVSDMATLVAIRSSYLAYLMHGMCQPIAFAESLIFFI